MKAAKQDVTFDPTIRAFLKSMRLGKTEDAKLSRKIQTYLSAIADPYVSDADVDLMAKELLKHKTDEKTMIDDPTKEEIVSLAKEYLDENGYLTPPNVTLKSGLAEELELDSLDSVGLLTYIEDTLGFAIPQEEARGIRTLQDIYNCYKEYA